MKKNFIISIVLFCIFILLTILVKNLDLGTNVEGIEVGFYSLNSKLLPSAQNHVFKTISNLCLAIGFIAFASVVILGIYEWIQTKSLKRVNISIYLYAALCLVLVIVYALFEKVVINYRPILVDGVKEASYPSTHILFTTTFAFATTYVFSNLFKNKWIKYAGYSFSSILTLLVFLGRLLSKNHWFTDCFASLVLSASLIMLFVAITQMCEHRINKKEEI